MPLRYQIIKRWDFKWDVKIIKKPPNCQRSPQHSSDTWNIWKTPKASDIPQLTHISEAPPQQMLHLSFRTNLQWIWSWCYWRGVHHCPTSPRPPPAVPKTSEGIWWRQNITEVKSHFTSSLMVPDVPRTLLTCRSVGCPQVPLSIPVSSTSAGNKNRSNKVVYKHLENINKHS